jgi:hypothetical protein
MGESDSAQIALRAYESLRGRFRAQESEWTVLSCVVARRGVGGDGGARVVSLATGTKCLGPGAQCRQGRALGDCHAEVLARRGLRLFLLNELEAALRRGNGGPDAASLIERAPGTPSEQARWRLRADVRLELFVSELPCGDCSIVTMPEAPASYTGAKPLLQPSLREDEQALGQLRRKSGRHDIDPLARSASLSCSDKVAQWAAVGLEGSLLSRFLEPVPLSALVLSADCLQPSALARSALERIEPQDQLPRLLGCASIGGVEIHADALLAHGLDPLRAGAVLEAAWRGFGARAPPCDATVQLRACAFSRSLRRAGGPDCTCVTSSAKRPRPLSPAGVALQWIWVPVHQAPRLGVESILADGRHLGTMDVIKQVTGQISGLSWEEEQDKLRRKAAKAQEAKQAKPSTAELNPEHDTSHRPDVQQQQELHQEQQQKQQQDGSQEEQREQKQRQSQHKVQQQHRQDKDQVKLEQQGPNGVGQQHDKPLHDEGPAEDIRGVPRTCRANLLRRFAALCARAGEPVPPHQTYGELKACCRSAELSRRRERFFTHDAFTLWKAPGRIVWLSQPAEGNPASQWSSFSLSSLAEWGRWT